MTHKQPSGPWDRSLTFGEHLRAQRLAAAAKEPTLEVFPEVAPEQPPIAPVIQRKTRRDHIQREAKARLREMRTEADR